MNPPLAICTLLVFSLYYLFTRFYLVLKGFPKKRYILQFIVFYHPHHSWLLLGGASGLHKGRKKKKTKRKKEKM